MSESPDGMIDIRDLDADQLRSVVLHALAANRALVAEYVELRDMHHALQGTFAAQQDTVIDLCTFALEPPMNAAECDTKLEACAVLRAKLIAASEPMPDPAPAPEPWTPRIVE